MHHRTHPVLAVLAVAASALVAACGGGTTSTASSTSVQWGNAQAVASSRAGAPDPKAVPASVVHACSNMSSPTIAAIKKAGVLNWGIGISPPFGFTGTSGKWQGVDAENAVELANILGVKPRIIAYDYSVMTTALETGRANIVGAQLFVTPEREKVIDFSKPYYLSGQVYYVLKSSKYQTIQDLNSRSNQFVYGTGGAQGVLAAKYTPLAHAQQVPLQGQLIPYQFLATGRADSTMGESAAWPVLRQKFTQPPLAAIGLHGRITGDLVPPGDELSPFQVAFGLPKNDAGWETCVDDWVSWGTTPSGTITQRVNYWLRNQNLAGG